MADDNQVESPEQNEQMKQTPDNASVEVDGNVQPDTGQDDGTANAVGDFTVSHAEQDVSKGENSTVKAQKESTLVAEQQAHETEEPVAETDQSPNHENTTDVNEAASYGDQKSHNRHSRDSNPDPLCHANIHASQNLNTSSTNVDADSILLEQGACVNSQPDEDTNNDSRNQDPGIASQDSGAKPTNQESVPPGQDLSSPGVTVTGVSDPENAEKVPEDSVPDSARRDSEEADDERSEPQEPDLTTDVPAQVTEEEVAKLAPEGDELQENQALDDDQTINEENVSCVNQEEDTGDVLDKVPTSQQPLIPEQTVEDITEGAAENLSGSSGSATPQSPAESLNNTLDAVQVNNNNEMNSGRLFSSESVRIPTAQGDVDESLPNTGSQENLQDPAMYKMRSSLPVDAFGDFKSNLLPALVHRDPRLARSLPSSMDPTSIPTEHHQGSGAHRTRSHIPRIPSASGSAKDDMQERYVRRALSSSRLPSSVLKMSTVMVSARKRAVLNRNGSVFYEEKQHSKVISLDQAINSRPPMPFDLDGPGPWSYSPRNKPLHEDNSPEYTFGHKLSEKSGGGRTAYSKTWFNSNNGFTQKVHYEKRWPSPAHYNSTRPLLGCRKPTMVDYPSFSIGVRSNFSISKKGSENEPAPNEYNRGKADVAVLKTAPSYTIRRRHQGTKLWSGNELTPGPGTYNPRWGYSSGAVHHPSFTIQGVRRLKSHQLGPHSTF